MYNDVGSPHPFVAKRPILAALNCGINDGSSFCGTQVVGSYMLCRVREVVLAYKHVGRKVPSDRQGSDHRQSERALSVEHFRSTWLGANQRSEVFLAQATGLRGGPRLFERGDTNAPWRVTLRPAIRVPPYVAGKHRPETGCHAPGRRPGSRPGERWTSRRPGPHLDQNVLGQLRRGNLSLDSEPLGRPLFRCPEGPGQSPLPYLAQTWHSKIAIRDETRK